MTFKFRRNFWRETLCCGILLFSAALPLQVTAEEVAASNEEEQEDLQHSLEEKQAKLEELQKKIKQLQQEKQQKEKEEGTLTSTLDTLNRRIKEARLELERTEVNIEDVRLRIKKNRNEIRDLEKRLASLREKLQNVLRTVYAFDKRSPVEMILRKGTFADFLQEREAYWSVQKSLYSVLETTAEVKKAREQREKKLKERQNELTQFHKLQEAQKNALKNKEDQKKELLAKNIQQQGKVAGLIAEAKQAREEIQQEIFTLRNAGIKLSLGKAKELARYAGKLTGVRPALLLGVLKVESNIGGNVGSGRYPDDMHPAHRDAFLRVTEKLGLNPEETPVSAKPTSYQGWGGAMGPGQIMPGTWERVESVVAKLTGKEAPSPFNLEDAFVATAVILQGSGAADGREFEAVNRYFAGPNWQRFTWYGDRVMAVAKEYEKEGL